MAGSGLCSAAATNLAISPSKSLVVTLPMSLGPTMLKVVLRTARNMTNPI